MIIMMAGRARRGSCRRVSARRRIGLLRYVAFRSVVELGCSFDEVVCSVAKRR